MKILALQLALRRGVWVALLPALLNGCGSLPSSGPSSSTIRARSDQEKRPGEYHMIPVTQEVVDSLSKLEGKASRSGLSSLAGPAKVKQGVSSPPLAGVSEEGSSNFQQRIVEGDTIGVTIFTMGGGLFPGQDPANAAGNSQTSLPPQLVDQSGAITIPHAGRIQAVGRTVHEIEKEITERLKGKAVDPWVIATIAGRTGGDLVTVAGDVNSPARIPVPLSGLRVLDAITSAGGNALRDHESVVTLTRGRLTKADTVGAILENPRKNIYLQPGDTIVVKGQRWSYTTFGAMGSQSLHAFDAPELSLAEALAKAGGTLDSRANPEAMFVYRFESTKTLENLGYKTGPVTSSGVPVIYQINLREPKGFFMASQFRIRNKDILFVGNAGTTGVMKFLSLVNAITAPARSSLSTAAGFDTFMQ